MNCPIEADLGGTRGVSSTHSAWAVSWLLSCALMVVSGCFGPSEEPVYPARGLVLYDERPLAEALVVLHPQDHSGRSLSARTGADGRFVVSTHKTGDGAPAGHYSVSVELREAVQEGDELMRTGRHLLPERYANPRTSGLHCVVEPRENEFPPWRIEAR